MSGGSFNYLYFTIEDTYKGEFKDEELEELLIDFCKVLHDLEWFNSCDISEESYLRTVKNFKKKWFSEPDERTKSRIEKFKKNLIKQIEKFE